jgi:hypothetical protein
MGDQLGNFTSSSPGTPAVKAAATGTEGIGVSAISSGIGVLSISTLAGKTSGDFVTTPGGSGVEGINGQPLGIGVTGTAVGEGGIGVQGNAQDGTAIQGTATTGTGVSANSGSGTGLSVASSGSFGSPQVLVTQGTPNDFARIRLGNSGTSATVGPWDIASGGPNGVLNLFSSISETNVLSASSNGDVTISGSLKQHSSQTLKENIRDLTSAEAVEAFKNLTPVQYQLRGDSSQSRHFGFIAEDMPDLIAAPDRKTICEMDIVAVLTKVLHQLRSDNVALSRRIEALENS